MFRLCDGNYVLFLEKVVISCSTGDILIVHCEREAWMREHILAGTSLTYLLQ